MTHLIQVGAGSGGMPVLDLLARDSDVRKITLIEPDVYKPHNVQRHLFPDRDVGKLKADLAQRWLAELRPDLDVQIVVGDLCDPALAPRIDAAVAAADFGICAADNEAAKIHWNALMLRHRKPWTLGEVLSGGIGGFVHGFVPDGPCYGCVASHLQRHVTIEVAKTPDYSQPQGPAETTVPASKTSIAIIAGLHAQITLQLLRGATYDLEFTSLLWTLERVPAVFEEAFRPYRFRIARNPSCLMCGQSAAPADLDDALEAALKRVSGDV